MERQKSGEQRGRMVLRTAKDSESTPPVLPSHCHCHAMQSPLPFLPMHKAMLLLPAQLLLLLHAMLAMPASRPFLLFSVLSSPSSSAKVGSSFLVLSVLHTCACLFSLPPHVSRRMMKKREKRGERRGENMIRNEMSGVVVIEGLPAEATSHLASHNAHHWQARIEGEGRGRHGQAMAMAMCAWHIGGSEVTRHARQAGMHACM